jgi:predicted aspartyl protease
MNRLILLAFLTCALGQAALAQQQSSSPSAPQQTIPIYSSNQHGLIIVRFDDGPSVPLLFDTGTTDNILDSAYAERLKLPHMGPSSLIDGARHKTIPGYASVVQRLTMRNVVRSNVPVQVTNFSHPEAVGLLGPYLFSGNLVQLDFGHDRLRILEKTSATIPTSEAEPYLGPPGDALPAAHVNVGGLTLQAVLDSGNSEAVTLPLSMASKIPLASTPVLTGAARSASGEQKIYHARLAGDLKLGPLTLRNPDIHFVEGEAEGNIGLPTLRLLNIVLDPAGRRGWIVGLAETQH